MPEQVQDQTEQSAVDIEDVDLSFANTKVVERPFAAEIRIDAKETGNWGPQYHLAVHPLHKADPDLLWHCSTRIMFQDGHAAPLGQFGEVQSALKQVHAKDSSITALGEHQLDGRVDMFVLRDYEYWDKKAKMRKKASRPSLIAIRQATDEDIAEAGRRMSTDTAGTPDAVRAPAGGSLSAEDLGIALQIMAGRKSKEYTKGLGSDETVPVSVREAIFSGSAKTQILQQGLATEVDGVLQPTNTEA